MASVFDFDAERLGGGTQRLADYAGRALLIVNTASRCGFTPQLAGLQALHARYAERGFAVLGFPCNQFGGQEPGDAGEIAGFCERDYRVSFPLFAKVEVNGPGAHPLFVFLKREAPGLFGTGRIKWNFTKFLVSADGRVLRRFAPRTKPQAIEPAILAALPPVA